MSEQDFLFDLPAVSSVTRLPQAQQDAPGAVTVLTREMIQQSGARDVVDLLRAVPGMYITGYNGAHRTAAHQASLDEYGTRMQVFVDGRSVYSTFYLGGASTALTTLPLDEIERIEVVRGNNSAAFGTNALFGVVNIVTRNSQDSGRFTARLANGGNDVQDSYASLSFGDSRFAMRLSAGTLEDDGFDNANDFRRVNHVRLRADGEFAPGSRWQLSAGTQRLRSIAGFASRVDNPLRPTAEETSFAAVSWERQLDAALEVRLSGDFTREQFTDRSLIALGPFLVDANLGGTSTRSTVEAQLSGAPTPDLRWLAGVGMRHENVETPIYFDGKDVSFDRLQAFGSLEWRPAAAWVLNAGAMYEHHDAAGAQWAPRLAVNWHLNERHTVRASASSAFRMPTLFESFANTVVRDSRTGMALYREYYQARVPEPERMRTVELGYLGAWPELRLNVDLRVYRNSLSQLIHGIRNTAKPPNDSSVTSVGDGELAIAGGEYQVRWHPFDPLEIRAGQTRQGADGTPGYFFENNVPRRIDTFGATYRDDNGLGLGLLYSRLGRVSSRDFGIRRTIDPTDQLDLNLAYRFKWGATRTELTLSRVAATGAVTVYNQANGFAVPPHWVGSLRLEL